MNNHINIFNHTNSNTIINYLASSNKSEKSLGKYWLRKRISERNSRKLFARSYSYKSYLCRKITHV